MDGERESRTGVGVPGTVVAAAGMLAAGGVLLVGEAWLAAERFVAGLAFQQQINGWQESEFGLVRAVGAASLGFTAVDLTGVVVGGVVGCCLVLVGLFTVLGHNWARLAGWILGFPVLLWCGVLLVFHAVAGLPGEGGDDSGEPAWPFWLGDLDVVLLGAGAALLVAALVCQTAPRADAYFRAGRGLPDDDGTITELLAAD